MLIRREVLETAFRSSGEYMPSWLFLTWDEMAFCFAARKAGHISVFAGKAIVYHRSKVRGSALEHYYLERNRLRLAQEMLPLYWKLLFYLSELSVILARIVKNMFTGRSRVNRAILWGVIDGYRGVTGKWRDHDREINIGRRGGPLKTGSEEMD